MSIVPVGLTKYREGLYPMVPFTKEEARAVTALVHDWQEKLYAKWGTHFIHCGDEWYILSEEDMPPAETYDGSLQLENGVGMTRLLLDVVDDALAEETGDDRECHLVLATGVLAGPFMKRIVAQVQQKFPGIHVDVRVIRNDFFGEKITVAGLLTAQDLIAQLSGTLDGAERLLIPSVMLKNDEPIFLDDMSLDAFSEALHIPVTVVESGGQDLVDAIINIEGEQV